MKCGKKVCEAIEALKAHEAKKKEGLVDGIPRISLLLGFHIIPEDQEQIIQVPLPHRIVREGAEICLFVKDVDKQVRDYEPTTRHYEQMLRDAGVTCVTKVIPMKALKTEYKPFEAKRNLSNMFDTFLADRTIFRFLPKFLGKHFLSRRRVPVGIKMKPSILKYQVETALKRSHTPIDGHGPNCSTPVGHIKMETKALQENIQAAVDKLSESIPGGWKNVKTLHLKTDDSPSLAIYVSTSSPNDVKLPKKKKENEWEEPEDVTPIVGGLVQAKKGDFKIVSAKRKSQKTAKSGKKRRGKKNASTEEAGEDGEKGKETENKVEEKEMQSEGGEKETENKKESKETQSKGGEKETENKGEEKEMENKSGESGQRKRKRNKRKKTSSEAPESAPQVATKKRKLDDSGASSASGASDKKELHKDIEAKVQWLKKARAEGKLSGGEEPLAAKTKGGKIKAKADLRMKAKSMQKPTESKKVIVSKIKTTKKGAKRAKQG